MNFLTNSRLCTLLTVVLFALMQTACSTMTPAESMADGSASSGDYEYQIGPGDTLDIFVWRNPDVSTQGVPVRPDGRISAPLVDSLMASGKTPSALADDIETILAEYIRDPLVTVTVKTITGGVDQLIRVIGEVKKPGAIPYSKNMTVLDVMLAVDGLTEFAAGNKASIARGTNGDRSNIGVRLDDLLRNGRVSANTYVQPGDILVVPQSLF